MPDTITDDWRAQPLSSPELAAHYAEVRSLQYERAERARRAGKVWGSLFAASMAGNLALATAVAALIPNQRLVPLPIILESDGTWDTAAAISSLPASQQEAVARAAVWQYVKARESYSWAAARYNYDLVSLMSAPAARDQYEHWFLPANKNSPQLTIGKKGQIDVEMIALAFIRPQVALVRFRRTLEIYGIKPETTTWSATVEIATTEGMTPHARLLDPGGIIVQRYSSSEDSASP